MSLAQVRKEAVERRARRLQHGVFFLKEGVRQEGDRTIHSWKSSKEEVKMLSAGVQERLKEQSGDTMLWVTLRENLMPGQASPDELLLDS